MILKEREERRKVLYYLRNSHILNFETVCSLQSRMIKYLFSYTNQMHSIYSLHTFTVFLLHVFGVTFTVISENMCARYLRPLAASQLLSMFTRVVTF